MFLSSQTLSINNNIEKNTVSTHLHNEYGEEEREPSGGSSGPSSLFNISSATGHAEEAKVDNVYENPQEHPYYRHCGY